MKLCPQCGEKAHRSQSRGFLEKRILKPLHIHAYRCRECNLRFHRFSFRDHSLKKHHDPGLIPPNAVRGRDGKDQTEYDQLVSDLRDGEKRAGLAPYFEDQE